MANMFDAIVKAAGNQYASKVAEGLESDVSSYVDTGSYSFNALLSGRIYGGSPSNKIGVLAGEESTGKTFYALAIAKNFLDANPTGAVAYFESEQALTKQILEDRGFDTNRIYVLPVLTIQDFRTQAVKMLDEYMTVDEDDRQPLLMILDSAGNLSTTKEVTDIAEGKDTRDMTRAQLNRGTFRVLALKLGRANVSLLMTNHVYDVIGAYFPTKELSGGGGIKYAASYIVMLSKSKKKDADNNVTGVIIKAKTTKSRLTRENMVVETLLDYSKGLDRFYGLIPIAEALGIAVKKGNKYVIDGKEAFENAINKNPEKFFTKDILDKIDKGCPTLFNYGSENDALVEKD
jgi:RecA/RadA recombinase